MRRQPMDIKRVIPVWEAGSGRRYTLTIRRRCGRVNHESWTPRTSVWIRKGGPR